MQKSYSVTKHCLLVPITTDGECNERESKLVCQEFVLGGEHEVAHDGLLGNKLSLFGMINIRKIIFKPISEENIKFIKGHCLALKIPAQKTNTIYTEK